MGLDLHLYDGEEEVAWINWSRNPFGLERWAEANVALAGGAGTSLTLWEVTNTWAYDRAFEVDRPLFQAVVLAYQEKLVALPDSYFFFDLPSYRQFVEPHLRLLPHEKTIYTRIVGEWYVEGKLAIPVGNFAHQVFALSRRSHTHYLAWFEKLAEFARLLQDPTLTFSCSS